MVRSDDSGRIYRLFCAARELDPADRQGFLERECGGDDALVRQIMDMLAYSEQSGGILSDPPWKETLGSTSVFHPGQMIDARYEILRFVGIGGMGEVYEARDHTLNIRIALKTIRPELARNNEAVARFMREVQLQREVVHGNVCRLFDVHRHQVATGQTIYFLTMEYLAGETLSAKLKRDGGMSSSEALPLALQVAAGLHAAHRENILHRDLKSANIMLTPGSDGEVRAVITDFGLARRIVPAIQETTVTHTGERMGTEEYMSPELLLGGKATIASDIYAFGIVLYEMLVGKRPFADHPSSVAAHKRSQRAPSIRESLPSLNRRWERVITGCLSTDPSRRPQLEEIVTELTSARTPFLSSRPNLGPALTSPWRTTLLRGPLQRRYSIWMVVGFVFLVSLLAVFLRLYMQDPKTTAGSYVYLADMTNATQDQDLDITGELLRSQLRQSGFVKLVDEAKVARARALMAEGRRRGAGPEITREIALRTSAALAVSSTLIRKGTGFGIYVDIERVGDSPLSIREHWSRELSISSKSQVFNGVKDAADWIRSKIGEPRDQLTERSVAPEEAASSSWEALRLFRDAEQLRRQRATSIGAVRPDDAAAAKLLLAIGLDPGFALARVRLADILLAKKEEKAAFSHLSLATDMSSQRRLTKWEELRARGTLAMATGQYRNAEGVFTELIALYPVEYIPVTALASALECQGRIDEALQWQKEAIKKDPTAPPPVVGLFDLLLLQGKLDEAEVAARRLAEMGATGLASERLGIVRFLKGDVSGARALFETTIRNTSPTLRSAGYSLLGSLFAETGQYQEALAAIRKGIDQDEKDGLLGKKAFKHLGVASILIRQGELQRASEQCAEALRYVENLEIKRKAATLLARIGRIKTAEEILEGIDADWKGPLADAARHQIRGEILLKKDRAVAALHEFQMANQLDPPSLPREYLARAYSLKGDWEQALPIYESVLKTKGTFWQFQDSDFPGIRTSILLDFAQIARAAGRRERFEAVLREYYENRPHADPALPETITARKLAEYVPSIHN